MKLLLLSDVLDTVVVLPSLPALVMELLATTEDSEVEIESLARKIALDHSLAVRTLRLANSPFYGMPHRVGTVAEAVAVLGLHSVRTLVVTATLADRLKGASDTPLDFMAFWRHAIGSALGARAIAVYRNADPEQAYTAGLLHEVGRLLLATRFTDHYAAVQAYRAANDCYPLDAERAVLGLDHAMVGEALTRHWNFPHDMQLAVAMQGADDLDTVTDLALVVRAADAISHALDLALDGQALVPAIGPRAWQRLGLDENALMEIFRQTDEQFQVACAALDQLPAGTCGSDALRA